jgi:hypothetical protein
VVVWDRSCSSITTAPVFEPGLPAFDQARAD